MSLYYFNTFFFLPSMGQMKDDILLRQIATQIKKLREARNVTQEVFYNDTNIHIGRIEQGKLNLSVSTLKAICTYLGVSLKEFFSLMEEK